MVIESDEKDVEDLDKAKAKLAKEVSQKYCPCWDPGPTG